MLYFKAYRVVFISYDLGSSVESNHGMYDPLILNLIFYMGTKWSLFGHRCKKVEFY
ncbi:MAG: hypothetical protein ACI84K_001226 [Pseudohongiellaceae bacterium]|jgi:hypothetical protein